MIRDIKAYPDKILKQKAKSVGQIDLGIKKLIDDMAETMYSREGVGLAANQVGEAKRIALVNADSGLLVLINPHIMKKKGKAVAVEGCLSLPGYELEIRRPQKILVEYLDKQGREKKIKAADLLARVICHEVDHLDGRTILDRLPFLKRIAIKRKLKKMVKH